MGGRMPPQVTYWTGTYDPEKEAISKELEALRQARSLRTTVVAFSPAHSTHVDPKHGAILLSADRWMLLRGLAALLERRGDVTHIFGGFSSWHLLRALGRRPIVLTAVSPRRSAPLSLPRLPAFVAVEADALVGEWRQAGMPASRIRVVYPGIDLSRFELLAPPSNKRLQLLFASSPASVAEFDERGIPLLVEIARRRRDVDVVVPWRQWGDVAAARRALDALAPPPNLHVHHDPDADMLGYFARAHATLTLFARDSGKSAPNSILEGLACGRPAIVTYGCGIARAIERTGAGVACSEALDHVSAAIDRVRHQLPAMRLAAHAAARELFDLRQFVRAYDGLYEEAMMSPEALTASSATTHN